MLCFFYNYAYVLKRCDKIFTYFLEYKRWLLGDVNNSHFGTPRWPASIDQEQIDPGTNSWCSVSRRQRTYWSSIYSTSA